MREQKNIIHKSATSRMSVVNVMPPITPIVSWSDELCNGECPSNSPFLKDNGAHCF
jgi:hypothetical protein